MAAGTKDGFLGALFVAVGVGLVAVASSAKAQAPRALTRAQTDAAFRAALYQFVPKATMDGLSRRVAESMRAGMSATHTRELLMKLVVEHIPWASVVAFNRLIIPMLEAGTATIPNMTPAQQLQIIQGVKAYGLDNPQMPPEYAATVQGAGLVAGAI